MAANPFNCPRCNGMLTPYQMSAGMIHVCGECGQWLDNEASRRLVLAELPDTAHQLLQPRVAATPDAGATYRTAANEHAIACPECKAALTPFTTNPAQLGVGVRLDVCALHGTWFDHGEAWTLLQSIALKRAALDLDLGNAARSHAAAAQGQGWNGLLVQRRWP